MVTQLRDYLITEGSLEQWVSEWTGRIAPLRRELDFTIDAAWTIGDESRFVWLLSYPGDWPAFEAADRAYQDSPERRRLDPNPARLIVEQRHARLMSVEL
jgi:hypothetical protein